jgi:hypothetical protein
MKMASLDYIYSILDRKWMLSICAYSLESLLFLYLHESHHQIIRLTSRTIIIVDQGSCDGVEGLSNTSSLGGTSVFGLAFLLG